MNGPCAITGCSTSITLTNPSSLSTSGTGLAHGAGDTLEARYVKDGETVTKDITSGIDTATDTCVTVGDIWDGDLPEEDGAEITFVYKGASRTAHVQGHS